MPHQGESEPIGGILLGGSTVAGSLVGGGFPTNHAELYHKTLGMGPHGWEMMREVAAQQSGFNNSQMWPKFKKEPLESPMHNYEKIMRAHSPVIAAKMLENEHSSGKGSGFFKALHHVMRMGVKGFGLVRGIVKKVMSAAELLKQMPIIGGFAEKVGKKAQSIDKTLGLVGKIGGEAARIGSKFTSAPLGSAAAALPSEEAEKLSTREVAGGEII